VKVRWTSRAVAHLREIREFIATDSPASALKMSAAIFEARDRLRRFPESGRLAGEWNGRAYREIIEPPYRILHEIQDETVFILALIHGRRDVAQVIANWKDRP
jgi:toxin ParE1/3/4